MKHFIHFSLQFAKSSTFLTRYSGDLYCLKVGLITRCSIKKSEREGGAVVHPDELDPKDAPGRAVIHFQTSFRRCERNGTKLAKDARKCRRSANGLKMNHSTSLALTVLDRDNKKILTNRGRYIYPPQTLKNIFKKVC